jgi:hypothetical protein
LIIKTESIEIFLHTAGGKITCQRCQAHSKRTKLQCGKPALKGKRVCQFHGGRSTGPKTEAGKARQKAAVTKSGNYTKDSFEARTSSMRMLHGLEDAMYVLNMTDAPRTRGRKPLDYQPLKTIDDIVQFAADNPLHLPEASAEHQK